MKRYDVIRELVKLREDELIVSNIGFPSRELYELGDDPKNFYMLGSLGLASSIGLGLALNCKRKVWVIDGDGGLLMNLGSLATIANQKPKNLVLIVVDDGAYSSTGGQPTYTSGVTDLLEIAKGAGIKQSWRVETLSNLRILIDQVKKVNELRIIIVKTESGNHPSPEIPMVSTKIRQRFMTEIQEMKK